MLHLQRTIRGGCSYWAPPSRGTTDTFRFGVDVFVRFISTVPPLHRRQARLGRSFQSHITTPTGSEQRCNYIDNIRIVNVIHCGWPARSKMAGNTKLLLVALCGAVLAASVLCVSGASTPTAYRGGAVNSAVPGAMQQQQASTAAGQASVALVQPMKVLPAAYRDSK
jgi:hypothetical protein